MGVSIGITNSKSNEGMGVTYSSFNEIVDHLNLDWSCGDFEDEGYADPQIVISAIGALPNGLAIQCYAYKDDDYLSMQLSDLYGLACEAKRSGRRLYAA